MSRFVAVVDLGKTNAKVALVDTEAAIEVTVLTEPAPTKNTLYPCLDHQAIEHFLIDALSAIASEYTVGALTVTTHGATAALIEQSGELALPVVDYEFDGIDDLRADYDKLKPDYEETGSPSLPGGLNVGAQLYWQHKMYPQHFAKASNLLTWPQYWVHRFGGERCNDLTSLGCHTDLLNPYTTRYSSLVSSQQWAALMPPIRNSGQSCGNIDSSLAKKTGLDPRVKIHVGIHDSNASLVPHLYCQFESFSVVSTGTWFISMAVGGTHTQLDENKDHLININARGNRVPTAMYMGGRERELLCVGESSGEGMLDDVLNNMTDEDFILPSVVQGTGPYPTSVSNWQESRQVNDSNRYACNVSLYLAQVTSQRLESIGATGPIFLEGPMTQDRVFAQALSVATEQPVMLSTSRTGTSIGAAMLITPPSETTSYDAVTVSTSRKAGLKQFTQQWLKRLDSHVK